MPAVSVLVPCFRSEGFLARALDSLLAQHLGDWEAIVVDNASDDGTHALALSYARRDPRFVVSRNPENLGPVGNWRRCAALARAPLAALLFSDDWYDPAFLAEAAPPFADPGVGFVWSAVRVADDPAHAAGAPVHYRQPGPPVRPSAAFLRAHYRRPSTVPVSPGCALFRREDLVRWLGTPLPDPERHRYADHGAGPDLALYLQACLAYPRAGHLEAPRVTFLWHGSNLTARPEVRRAYAVTSARFLDAADGAARLGARPRARLAARLEALGEPGPAAALARPLGPLGKLWLARERHLARRRARRAGP